MSDVMQFQNGNKEKRAAVYRKILIHAGMVFVALILIFPYMYMLLRSLMTGAQVQLLPTEIIPRPISFQGWMRMFGEENYGKALLQTMKIIGFNVIAVPLSGSFVAYGFAKNNFFGKKFVFALMMATMLLPGAVLQTPLYVMFGKFGWLETPLPLTLPNLFGGGAIYIFLIRQYMIGIPNELEEASRIDGANAFRRYCQITLPLCFPVLVYIVINVFNAAWSDFYGPLLYMSTSGKETLAYLVFNGTTSTNITPDKTNIRMAAGMFMSIFPAMLFVIFQKQLIDGVSTSALKG